MGLAFGSIPFLLKERGSTYADLAHFSLASLPYTLKLFIAPIVDSFYSPAFGRRKSWIVPVQLVIGLVATLLAPSIDLWVRSGNVALLTPTFLLLLALAATQDIAVDGWSLTMLRKSNVQYASTCQSLGLSLGFFSTFTIFLAFSNAAFCDGYIRPLLFWSIAKGPLATLQSVLRWSGLYYLLLTLYITIFKQETADGGEEKKTDDVSSGDVSPSKTGVDLSNSFPAVKRSRSVIVDSILATYSDLLIVTRKPAVRSLVVALLVAKVGFSAHDNGKWRNCRLNAAQGFAFFATALLTYRINFHFFCSSIIAETIRSRLFKRKYGLHGRHSNSLYNACNYHNRAFGGKEIFDRSLSLRLLFSFSHLPYGPTLRLVFTI